MSPMDSSDLALELAITRLSGEMQKSFAEVNGKLDLFTADALRHASEVAALEARVSALEKRMWMAAGAAALVGIVIPLIVQVLGGK